MERYYYHGVSDLLNEISLDIILNIIKTGGIKTRNEIGNMNDDKYNHVCLYKKKERVNYSKKENYYRSARSGWIDHCFVFIISPNIKATYEKNRKNTNLVDEWRSEGDILLDKIVGIALPFDSIDKLKEDGMIFTDTFDKKMKEILKYCSDNNWLVANSDEEDFCDILDEKLKN